MIVVPTCVYRFYDKDDRLLYVGMTDSPGVRFNDHARRNWWKAAVRNTITWYDTREEAAHAEAEALRTEQPIHNVAGVEVPLPRTREELHALPRVFPRPKKDEPRRAKGDGSLYLKKREGRADLWVARVHLGWSREGKRLVKEFTSYDRDIAEARMMAFIAEQQQAS